MFDQQAHTRSNQWWEDNTRSGSMPQMDPMAPTASRPVVAPEYAWSAEPVTSTADVPRSRRLLLPVAAICAGGGVVAAVAAALFVTVGGHAAPTATASAHPATTVANTQPAAAPMPPAPPAAAAPAAAAPAAPVQATHRQASHSVTSYPTTVSPASAPTTTDNSEWNGSHGQQWQEPRYDTESRPPTWNWNSFRPHWDSEWHGRTRDGGEHGQHGWQSSEHQSSGGDSGVTQPGGGGGQDANNG